MNWQPPHIPGGIHNPTKALNDMALQLYGQQLQVAPPLVLETVGTATLLRLDEAATTARTLTEKTNALPIETLQGETKTSNLFAFSAEGVYLITGAGYVQCRSTPPKVNRCNVYLDFDGVTGAIPIGKLPIVFPNDVSYYDTGLEMPVFFSIATFVTVDAARVGPTLRFVLQNNSDATSTDRIYFPGNAGGGTAVFQTMKMN